MSNRSLDDYADENKELKAEIAALRTEVAEQARLLGMSGSREADLSRLVEASARQVRSLLTRVAKLEEALRPFAKIEVPDGVSAGTWVAKTVYCNTQVTAHSVRAARALLSPPGPVSTRSLDESSPPQPDPPIDAEIAKILTAFDEQEARASVRLDGGTHVVEPKCETCGGAKELEAPRDEAGGVRYVDCPACRPTGGPDAEA